MKNIKFGQILGVIVIIIALIFAFSNVESVQVNVLFSVINAPMFLIIIVSLLLGMLAQFLFSYFRGLSKK